MGQQTLRTVIVLSGRIDNTFGKVGESLITLGNEIDTISQKIIGFGKESTKEFVEYDDIMREVQALGEYDTKTMRALDEYNKSIAQTSKYTMDQAGQAEVLMAQLGLNMDETRTLMPTVMDLATAANIELADSLDYLYYTLNALDMPMEQANMLADQMSKASAISAADIDTLGQSLQRLGSGAQYFVGGSDEVLAILAGIAQFGNDMQGSNAGTQLRNFMLTLMAPTKSKAEILDSLAISEAEWAEFESYMEDAGIELTNTAAEMEKLGFSIYDSSGKLKPAIQIVGELEAALKGMGDEEKKATLGNLFGKRTTITAENLLAALPDIIRYQEQIENGSFGYTDYMAGIQEGGLGGALREFTSAWDALETTVGELISPEVESAADTLTGMVNSIANMDSDKMEIIAGGLAGIAAAGPGMLLAGGAFRLIGYVIGSKAGAIAFGAMALAALAGAAVKWNEVKFEDNFGTLAVDSETLKNNINSLTTEFENVAANTTAYDTALANLATQYETTLAAFSTDLSTYALIGKELTQADIDSLTAYGESITDTVLKGIGNRRDSDLTLLNGVLGDQETAEEELAYNSLWDLLNGYYGDLWDQAEGIGKDLNEAILTAFEDDGRIDEVERSKIQQYADMLSEIQAEIASRQEQSEYYAALEKAGRVSYDSIEEYLKYNADTQDSRLSTIDDLYYSLIGTSRAAYENELGYKMTDEAWHKTEEYQELKREWDTTRAQIMGQHGDLATAAMDALMGDSNLSDTWAFLKQVQADGLPENMDLFDWGKYAKFGTPEELSKMLGAFISADNGIFSLFTGGRLSGLLEPYSGNQSVQDMLSLFEIADNLQIAAADRASWQQWSGGYQPEITTTVKADVVASAVDSEALSTEMDVVGGAEAAQEAHAEAQGIMDEDLEQGVKVDDHGSTASMYSYMRAMFSQPIYQTVTVRRVGGVGYGGGNIMGFAEGGRATIPSIFAEAGPEWAIPEEHTDRTAQLLNAAREGAGFTWRELIDRNGGLNAGGGGSRTLIYQPTIIANDAGGVEDKLIEDKRRLDRWYAEKELRDDVEVYS